MYKPRNVFGLKHTLQNHPKEQQQNEPTALICSPVVETLQLVSLAVYVLPHKKFFARGGGFKKTRRTFRPCTGSCLVACSETPPPIPLCVLNGSNTGCFFYVQKKQWPPPVNLSRYRRTRGAPNSPRQFFFCPYYEAKKKALFPAFRSVSQTLLFKDRVHPDMRELKLDYETGIKSLACSGIGVLAAISNSSMMVC